VFAVVLYFSAGSREIINQREIGTILVFQIFMKNKFPYPLIIIICAILFTNNTSAAGISNLKSVYKISNQVEDTTKPVKPACREIECRLFIQVDKADQLLYLHVDGVLQDTFPVSTGKKDHDTPEISMRPSGPTYKKYTSRKYPGGNYQGLGNMPYVVFIKGGYAIHGTTPGNFLKLGHRASHGCIRLHPNNAKQVFDLVNMYGLENTWVKVSESL
jgi:lipoprotein-anchoring transpeptidase ErfK/SrfK